MTEAVLSLFDRSGNMVKPWANAGYECFAIDIENEPETVSHGDGVINYLQMDVREDRILDRDYVIGFAFPPCTHLSVSGARWFEQKGLTKLSDAIELVEIGANILERETDVWMLENPVSTLSTYWREPDYTFHPYEYDGYTERDEAYSKKTCLWTSDGFTMPDTESVETYDDRIHKMAPGEERSKKRAVTPMGFSKAVFRENFRHV